MTDEANGRSVFGHITGTLNFSKKRIMDSKFNAYIQLLNN